MPPTESHAKTVYYRRWGIGYTIKRGYEPDSMTVSAEYEEGKEPDHDTMIEMARACITEATKFCDELNQAKNATFSGDN